MRWGILGTGTIAAKMATALAQAGSPAVAVGSRTRERARAFAAEHGIARAHGGYEELVADPALDVVYVATPHALHRPHTILALEHGKHVLCEKPLAVNAREARAMVEAARRHGRFLMEAMWTRMLPAVQAFVARSGDGTIGAPRTLLADFGFRGDGGPGDIVFDPALGGGALLDVGVYPVSLAFALFGRPTEAVGLATLAASGIDEQHAVALAFAGGEMALLHAAITVDTPQEAVVLGSAGQVRLHAPWWAATAFTVTTDDGATSTVEHHPYDGNGYVHEVREVERAIGAGLLESPVMPLAESVAILETLDTLRARSGPRYPADDEGGG